MILRKGEGDGDYWSMPVISINPGRVYVDFNKKNPLTGLSAYDILAAFVFRMYKSQKSAQPKNQLSDVELA